jgi:hypothetical protein
MEQVFDRVVVFVAVEPTEDGRMTGPCSLGMRGQPVLEVEHRGPSLVGRRPLGVGRRHSLRVEFVEHLPPEVEVFGGDCGVEPFKRQVCLFGGCVMAVEAAGGNDPGRGRIFRRRGRRDSRQHAGRADQPPPRSA